MFLELNKKFNNLIFKKKSPHFSLFTFSHLTPFASHFERTKNSLD